MEAQTATLLVIDGDPASLTYLSSVLAKGQYKVISSSSGREGMVFAWRDQPQAIIFDPLLTDLTGLEFVTRLRQDRRTAKIPFVALSSHESAYEKQALLAAGCNEYLPKSNEVIQRLLELLPRLLNLDLKPVVKGRMIAFLSAKGGTGTSSLCANIANGLAVQQQDKKIAVVDLVLPIGSIADIVGYNGQINIATAAEQKSGQATLTYLEDNLPLVNGWYFHLLAGASDPESSNRISPDRIEEILKAILESYDYILVDLGRSLSRISMPVIRQAEVVVLILSTDIATANLTIKVLKYLKDQGVNPARIFALQNRAVGLEGLTKGDLEKKIGLPVRITMPYMGDNVTVANNRNEPLIARSPNDSASMLIKQVGLQMLEMGKKKTGPIL